MSGRGGGKILGIIGIALVVFLSIISAGAVWAIIPYAMQALLSVSIGLITTSEANKQKREAMMNASVSRNAPSSDPEALACYIFGTTLVPLNLVYEEVTGSAPDRVLHDVYAHAWHKINAYLSLTVGAKAGPEVVSFTGDAATGGYSNLLWWYRKDGTQSTALSGTFFDPNAWPSDAVFTGVAHSGFVWNVEDDNFQDKFGSAPQKIEVEVEGAMLYDPRLDNTYGSGSQDFATPSTWGFNNGNAALVLLRGLIGEYASTNLVWGRGAPESMINMASFIAMANVAEESLDGDIRFRLGGMWPVTGNFEDFVQQWEHETGGKLSKAGGLYTCWLPNDDLTPATTITEADVIGGQSIQYTIAGGLESLYNTARGRFIDSTNGYTGVPYPEISESSAVTEDGGKRVFTQDFAWVQTQESAQRIARLAVRRSRFMRLWSVPMGWKGQAPAYAVFSIHYLNCKETNYANQLVRVIDRKTSYTGATLLTLQQEDASIYDETLTLLDPLANSAPPNSTSIYDTLPRVIGADGSDAVYGTLTASDGLVFTQAPNGGSWSPVSTTTDLTFTFVQGGSTIATHVVRVTRSGATLTAATQGSPTGDSTTLSTSGSGTNALTVTMTHDADSVSLSTLVIAAQGGSQGSDGSDGGDGTNGLSIFYASAYIRASSPPSTPTGGSYNFSTQVLTAPTSWSATPPAGANALYVSTATFSVSGTTGTDSSTTWSSPELFVENGEGYWTPNLVGSMSRVGKTFTKIASDTVWDSGFYSSEKFGACQISWQPAQADKYFMIGLNTDPTTDADYASIDYALYCQNDGTLLAYESGSPQSVGGVSYVAGDALAVQYDGNHVRYLKNGAVLRTVPNAGALFYADSSFYNNGAAANNVVFTLVDMGKIDLTTKVFNQLTATFADAGLVNTNISVNADGSLTGAGGGAPTISSLTGSVATGQLTTNVLAALQAVIGNLAAINADIGAITAGTITLASSGHVKSGQTAYNTGAGFFLGYSSGAGRFSLGNPSTNYLTWDGSTLSVRGVLDFAAQSFTPNWSAGFGGSPPSGDFKYIDFGSYVALWWSPSGTLGTSNANDMSIDNLPSAILPSAAIQVAAVHINNGAYEPGFVIVRPSAVVDFAVFALSGLHMVGGNNFFTTGSKGPSPGNVYFYSKA